MNLSIPVLVSVLLLSAAALAAAPSSAQLGGVIENGGFEQALTAWSTLGGPVVCNRSDGQSAHALCTPDSDAGRYAYQFFAAPTGTAISIAGFDARYEGPDSSAGKNQIEWLSGWGRPGGESYCAWATFSAGRLLLSGFETDSGIQNGAFVELPFNLDGGWHSYEITVDHEASTVRLAEDGALRGSYQGKAGVPCAPTVVIVGDTSAAPAAAAPAVSWDNIAYSATVPDVCFERVSFEPTGDGLKPATITLRLYNLGNGEGMGTAILRIDGILVGEHEIAIGPGEHAYSRFSWNAPTLDNIYELEVEAAVAMDADPSNNLAVAERDYLVDPLDPDDDGFANVEELQSGSDLIDPKSVPPHAAHECT